MHQRKASVTGKVRVVNLEAGKPTVEQARAKLNSEIARARSAGVSVLKIIHGYGSSGVGGRLRGAIRSSLRKRRKEKRIRTFVPGEKWSVFEAPVAELLETHLVLKSDRDLDNYNDQNINTILDTYKSLKDALRIGRERHITLITKIMVATFGCVPAFDQYLFEGIRRVLDKRARIPSDQLTVDSLNILAAFYRANRKDIDTLHNESRTVAFGSDSVTEHKLSRAKIVDMYCFSHGRSTA